MNELDVRVSVTAWKLMGEFGSPSVADETDSADDHALSPSELIARVSNRYSNCILRSLTVCDAGRLEPRLMMLVVVVGLVVMRSS